MAVVAVVAVGRGWREGWVGLLSAVVARTPHPGARGSHRERAAAAAEATAAPAATSTRAAPSREVTPALRVTHGIVVHHSALAPDDRGRGQMDRTGDGWSSACRARAQSSECCTAAAPNERSPPPSPLLICCVAHQHTALLLPALPVVSLSSSSAGHRRLPATAVLILSSCSPVRCLSFARHLQVVRTAEPWHLQPPQRTPLRPTQPPAYPAPAQPPLHLHSVALLPLSPASPPVTAAPSRCCCWWAPASPFLSCTSPTTTDRRGSVDAATTSTKRRCLPLRPSEAPTSTAAAKTSATTTSTTKSMGRW